MWRASRKRHRGSGSTNERVAGPVAGSSFPVSRVSRSARPEQPVSCVTESGQDVAVLIELAVETRGEHGHVGMVACQSGDTLGGGDETEEANARGACALE